MSNLKTKVLGTYVTADENQRMILIRRGEIKTYAWFFIKEKAILLEMYQLIDTKDVTDEKVVKVFKDKSLIYRDLYISDETLRLLTQFSILAFDKEVKDID